MDNSEHTSGSVELSESETNYLAQNNVRCKCGHMEAFHAFLWDNMGGDRGCLICSCPWNAYGYEWEAGDPFGLQSEESWPLPDGWTVDRSDGYGRLVRPQSGSSR